MRKNFIKYLALFSCIMFVTGCSESDMSTNETFATTGVKSSSNVSSSNSYDSSDDFENSSTTDESIETDIDNTDITETNNKEDKLVYTYDLSFNTFKDDSEKVIETIDTAVEKTDSFVENSSYNDTYYSLTVKVPTNDRDKFVELLTKDLTYENYSLDKKVENKTSEYNDLQRNYDIQKDNYDAYSRLLSQAGTLDEVLEVTKYVNDAKNQMDYYQGLMNGIDEDVIYSTVNISVSFRTVMTALDKDMSFGKELATSFKEGINSFLMWLQNLILAVVEHIIPICILIVIFIFVVRYRKKHPVKEDKRYSYKKPEVQEESNETKK